MGIVTIIGRPNVGKSSLFNRLLGKRSAIVDDFPGVTRDRLYGEVTYEERNFYIVDTGGIMAGVDGPFSDLVKKQVDLAMNESNLLIFVIDGREGITPMDEEIATLLRKSGKPIILAMNKLDNPKLLDTVYDAYELGFDRVVGISAEHNINIDELLDATVALLEDDSFPEEDDAIIPVTLVGRPNVGKSSLLNALTGEERALVSDIPGTTRDVVDSLVEIDGTTFRILDTAGLRRKARINSALEYYSGVRTYQAIDACRVAIVMLDATEPVTDQDKHLIGHVLERGKGLILAMNKWDLAPREDKIGDKMKKLLAEELPFASHAPSIFISALSKRGLDKLPAMIRRVDENRQRRVSTSTINRLVQEILAFERMPGDGHGHHLKISFCLQANGTPPAFVFFVNNEKYVTKSFSRHLENIVRKTADFSGTPVRIFFRAKH